MYVYMLCIVIKYNVTSDNSPQITRYRQPLLGYSIVNNLSARNDCTRNRGTRHATIGKLQEAVLPRGPARGGQCRYNGTRDTTPPSSTEERCFLLSPLRCRITRQTDSSVESRHLWDSRQPVIT
jgi:hypothetical protein